MRLICFCFFVLTLFLPVVAHAQGFHVKRTNVMHIEGNGGVRAFTTLIPVGWQTEGGVIWTPQDSCNSYGFNFNWQAQSPDGSFGVMIFPSIRWTSVPGNGIRNCPIKTIRSAREFLEWAVAEFNPGARVLDYRPRPDILQENGAKRQRIPMPGGEMSVEVDAGEVLFAFKDKQGRDVRASAATAITIWRSVLYPAYGFPGQEFSGGSSLPGWATHAPNGQLNLRASEALRKSIVPDPNWTSQIIQHMRIIDKDNRETALNIADINRRANAEVNNIINKGYAERSAIQDRGRRESIEAIRGVETFNDPVNGGTVQLDNTYKHHWQLNDGTFIMTDDEFFQPFQHTGQSGQRLTVTP